MKKCMPLPYDSTFFLWLCFSFFFLFNHALYLSSSCNYRRGAPLPFFPLVLFSIFVRKENLKKTNETKHFYTLLVLLASPLFPKKNPKKEEERPKVKTCDHLKMSKSWFVYAKSIELFSNWNFWVKKSLGIYSNTCEWKGMGGFQCRMIWKQGGNN